MPDYEFRIVLHEDEDTHPELLLDDFLNDSSFAWDVVSAEARVLTKAVGPRSESE